MPLSDTKQLLLQAAKNKNGEKVKQLLNEGSDLQIDASTDESDILQVMVANRCSDNDIKSVKLWDRLLANALNQSTHLDRLLLKPIDGGLQDQDTILVFMISMINNPSTCRQDIVPQLAASYLTKGGKLTSISATRDGKEYSLLEEFINAFQDETVNEIITLMKPEDFSHDTLPILERAVTAATTKGLTKSNAYLGQLKNNVTFSLEPQNKERVGEVKPSPQMEGATTYGTFELPARK